MNRLWYQFKSEWGRSELKDGVEFFGTAPWVVDNIKSNQKLK